MGRAIVLVAATVLLLASCNKSMTQPTVTPSASTQSGTVIASSLDGWAYDTAGRRLEGTAVEILDGPRAGAVMSTGADGYFVFDGPFAAVPRMQASKAGYKPSLTNVFLLSGTTIIRGMFQMASPNPPADLGGSYQLTFTAAPSCTALPGAARSRSYSVSVPHGNADWHLFNLTGAHFVTVGGAYDSNVVYVGVFENFVNLNFNDPPIWEQLDGTTSVYISGSAQGDLSGPVTTLRLAGEFEFCGDTDNGTCEKEISCESQNHTLTLTRR